MSVAMLKPRASKRLGGLFTACLSALAALAVAGCSADSSRFDPNFGLARNDASDGMVTSSLPVPSQTVYGGAPPSDATASVERRPLGNGTNATGYGSTGYGSPSYGAPAYQPSNYQPQAYPQAGYPQGSYPQGSYPQASYQPPAAQPPRLERAAPPPQPATTSAVPVRQTVVVERGDNLSSIARRHDVTVQDVMQANDMTSTRLSIGQELTMPGGATARAASTPARGGVHVVARGESLSAIADRYDVDYAELSRYNGIAKPDLIQPGQTIKIPGAAANAAAADHTTGVRVVRTRASAAQEADSPVRVASAGPTVPVPQSSPSRDRSPPMAGDRADAPPERETASLTPAPMSGTEFRWPVRGRVISKFGSKPNGKHNDGINVAVPQGTHVKAAENGVVAYAGNELEGYGNLILLRHADGWVSAYAHNDQLVVKRGETVKRGQLIAKAGQSGAVNQPQLHFELRKGSKPVDPLLYMADM